MENINAPRKHVLVTGGLGFLGARIAQYLSAVYEITLATSRTGQEITPPFSLRYVNWDDPASLERACAGVDYVIHTAGVNAPDSMENPELALLINGVGTLRLVKAAKKAGVQKIVYFSTAHVYRQPLTGTITEDTCTLNLHPYATSHRAGEDAVLAASERNFTTVVIRLSNSFGEPVYAANNCWSLLVNGLCKQVVETGLLQLTSTGLQERDFISISNVTRAVSFLLGSDRVQGIYNLGSGSSVSVLQMAQHIARRVKHVLGFDPILQVPAGSKQEQVAPLQFKIEKLRGSGFVVQHDVDEEVDKLLQFCAAHFKKAE
ncbi:NAD-dependent epimerase/dehydratase family protein [Sediminibacterium roseum]|uniref:NAD-dependent epimerase/dehydratase family protein n=1 Tax=Sediminibacterium roseum TaxID=1978412 RepID=A0ABW9ZPR8_9BACT|nr:NAD-dependent epimerase/dehydratase family protein [Sediminibacterium roseum]NCI49096.1 NAD-dependent epimerase/dehydratase family protein [Sediminibacterium roseum]